MDTETTDMGRRTLITAGASAAAALCRWSWLPLAGAQPAEVQGTSQSITSPETQPPFDPTNYPIVPPKRFEDLKVGDVFRAPGRTLTPSITSAFQAVSLDNNPRHYNEV
jgi:hypothetical protein